MTYGTTAAAKKILRITDSTNDTEIGECVAEASVLTDEMLRPYGVTVPLTTVPTIIDNAVSLWGAGVFRWRRSPSEGEKFIVEAKKQIKEYAEANHASGSFTGTGGLSDIDEEDDS